MKKIKQIGIVTTAKMAADLSFILLGVSFHVSHL